MSQINLEAVRRILTEVQESDIEFTDDELLSTPKEYLATLLHMTRKDIAEDFKARLLEVLDDAHQAYHNLRMTGKSFVLRDLNFQGKARYKIKMNYSAANQRGLLVLQKFLRQHQDIDFKGINIAFRNSNRNMDSLEETEKAILKHPFFFSSSDREAKEIMDLLGYVLSSFWGALTYTMNMPADTDYNPDRKPTWAELSGVNNAALLKKSWSKSIDSYVSFIQISKEVGF